MLVTLEGITTEVKPEQPENAFAPMLVTLEGITIEDKAIPLNAYAPMLVTLEGIEEPLHPTTKVFVAVSMMALHPSRLSCVWISSLTTMVVMLAQIRKENIMLSMKLAAFLDMMRVVRLSYKYKKP